MAVSLGMSSNLADQCTNVLVGISQYEVWRSRSCSRSQSARSDTQKSLFLLQALAVPFCMGSVSCDVIVAVCKEVEIFKFWNVQVEMFNLKCSSSSVNWSVEVSKLECSSAAEVFKFSRWSVQVFKLKC